MPTTRLRISKARRAVTIEVSGREYKAKVLFESGNRKSLMLDLGEEGIRFDSGLIVGLLPVLGDPATGEYVDLIFETSLRVISG
jgi:hypothetical protein